MDFEYSAKTKELQKKLLAFMDQHIYPNESKYYAHVRSDKRWEPVPIIEELKPKAAGLWNLFLPHSARPAGPSTSLRAALRDHGARFWSPKVFNCSAPDTGNMETIERYGTEEEEAVAGPLLEGKIAPPSS
jgi:acyl-CoA dehydrogenase